MLPLNHTSELEQHKLMKPPGPVVNYSNTSCCQNSSGLRCCNRFTSWLMMALIRVAFPSVRAQAVEVAYHDSLGQILKRKSTPNHRHYVGLDTKSCVDTLPSTHLHWKMLMFPKALDRQSEPPLWPTCQSWCVWDQALQPLSVKSSVLHQPYNQKR